MSGEDSNPIEITIGLFLTVFAGVLNGSWNASFDPILNLAVGKSVHRRSPTTTSFETNNGGSNADVDLEYHHAFALFQIYASLLNLAVCFVWAGGLSNVQAVIHAAPTGDILLVALFSFLWGLGSLGFGLACKIAGVGLGTNLTIGLIVVTGTFLPLCYKGVIQQPTGWSLRSRDLDVQQAAATGKEVTAATTSRAIFPQESNDREYSPSSSIIISDAANNDQFDTVVHNNGTKDKSYSTAQKVAVCMVSGLLATQLQFAFVFGQNIVDLANENGNTPAGGAAAIIWLFAISIGCPPIVAYMLYQSPDPIGTMWLSLWRRPARHVKLFLTTSVPWVAHIHLYGLVSNKLLPSQIGSSIAWPLLMMTTVAQGMVLSILLGEWKNSSARTRQKVRLGLGIVFLGMVMIMTSAAV